MTTSNELFIFTEAFVHGSRTCGSGSGSGSSGGKSKLPQFNTLPILLCPVRVMLLDGFGKLPVRDTFSGEIPNGDCLVKEAVYKGRIAALEAE